MTGVQTCALPISCAGIDATAETVSVARALIAGGDQVVLVDLAGGPASVSDALGLPSSPGLAELSAGRARFEDIVRIDAETPLQVITAGDPARAAAPRSPGRFASVFEALTKTYDGVVLHADGDTLRKLTSVLRFELSVAIAVADTASGAGDTKPDLSAFTALGCPVLVYDRDGKEQRSQSPAAPVSRAVASNG